MHPPLFRSVEPRSVLMIKICDRLNYQILAYFALWMSTGSGCHSNCNQCFQLLLAGIRLYWILVCIRGEHGQENHITVFEQFISWYEVLIMYYVIMVV